VVQDRNQLRDILRRNEPSGCIKTGAFHQLTDSQTLSISIRTRFMFRVSCT
jgi:hypothetical protein